MEKFIHDMFQFSFRWSFVKALFVSGPTLALGIDNDEIQLIISASFSFAIFFGGLIYKIWKCSNNDDNNINNRGQHEANAEDAPPPTMSTFGIEGNVLASPKPIADRPVGGQAANYFFASPSGPQPTDANVTANYHLASASGPPRQTSDV